MVGARTFPGNPYDGHILRKQLEQVSILLEGTGKVPKRVVVDLGFRGADHDNPGVAIIHRGKDKSLSQLQRHQAVEPAIGHLRADHRMIAVGCKGRWATPYMPCYVPPATICAGCSGRWPD
ncbi:hypothetical protein GCM10011289_23970 [Paludibacterium paludis]|uniref:Transposase IS4-like domain-containing protein n=1 Tax=Paludibacterium paludis TaxID=1225769 RepID=A0A918UAM1_9NEIS|nr:hypothetical protein GCM10011289_23970 [Paludibacterium paludis]